MSVPADLEHLRAATAQLLSSIASLTDAQARAASALSGWTRGHVLTHIARNADAHWRMNDAALAGRFVDMYEGGRPAKNRVIEELSARPASDLVEDVRASAARLQAQMDAIAGNDWERMTRPSGPGGALRSIAGSILSRWREVEVHHVDLALSYMPTDWSPAYVAADLADVLQSLPGWARDVPIGASWQLQNDDDGSIWLVDGESVTAGPGAATYHVRGPGYALLGWLLGRGTSTALAVEQSENAADALALPRYFPFG